ncbi:class III lanthionine synthetase LanKC N-terminal domain-containing protein [Staphylococcus americanisciuri]|uniref:Protein kinase n=1 Tax=Staphylococcus americanisciuri TaxID=2973940 RepID=A0ABT2F0A3_9STAP|nr:protein kinase [Staphylococcus americanisciuri]MCS4485762.1 protein kinase [Staphylococcus americanisciuri]
MDIEQNNHWSYCSFFDQKKMKNHGFKIHISGSINNAHILLNISLPYLVKSKLNFKVVSSLNKLELQNSGIYGQSQIGKLITIYPEDNKILNKTLFDLHLITKGYNSPLIPSDFQYRNSGVVYYRYGLFISNESNTIQLSNGKLFKDTRERIVPPDFQSLIFDYQVPRYSILPKHLIILEVLSVRGKGSTYKVFDLKDKKIKIMKEGKPLGEIEDSGIDGTDRVIWEAFILSKLNCLTHVPSLHDYFYIGNHFYIIEDFIEGSTLENYCLQSDFNRLEILSIMIQITEKVNSIHKMGFIINDLSMGNIIIDLSQNIHIIDLEFSFSQDIECPPFMNVGTPGFFNENRKSTYIKDDIYSLVCIYYYLLLPSEYSKLTESIEDLQKNQIYSNKNLGLLKNDDKEIINKGLNGEIQDINSLLLYFKELYAI